MITFDNFSFRYEERDKFTLKDLNLTIQTGEFVLLTGRSGCGKTTLIRCLNGLIPHFYPGESKGDILLDGHSLLELKPSDLAGKVGTVFQDPRSQFFMTDTTRELAFGCENMGYSREETVDRIAKAVLDLELSDYLNRSIFDLSSGEKQQIAIGSVYALLPKVYIFDEPSANLDYAATKRLAETMKRLKADGYTIIVVEHRFYYLRELLDRAYLIQDGRLIQSFTREQFCSLSDETRIQYGLRTVYPEREAAKYQLKPAHKSNDGLSVSNLSFAYKKGPDVLRNINFEAHKGDVIGILGHNGAGKTTLLSIMTGLLKEKTGSIRYNGKKLSPRQRRNLSYLVMEELRAVYADRFVLSCVNRKIITAKHLQKQESGAVLLTDDGRRAFLGAWQSKKQEQITHPFLKEKIPWGLVPYVQALLLARTLRGDLEAYPPFFWK